jgi:hypothetical protein
MSRDWYKKSYRRNLVDMHIEDWDERFLSQFDPKKYVELLKLAHVKSTMFYANSHVGLCYWPTETGRMHRGLGSRDILGEVISLCHQEGIDVVLYYSVVYNNWAYAQHPEWRLTYLNGTASRDRPSVAGGRYGFCCPNSPGYRKFVVDQIEELCRNYDFEGVFFDMTFWPGVCYCPSCRERYKREAGAEPPTVINWDDPSWLTFQKKREEWMTEFTAMATNAVKKHKPEAAVEHQCSSVVRSWVRGINNASFSEQFDFTAGDFYGGVLQQSFICKMFYNLTKNMPFEFHTSICYPSLIDHTTTKPRELVESRAFMAFTHHGAFSIIDAVDPVGTVDERRYRMTGDIYKETSKYEEFFGGELCQDVAIYFSSDSKMNFEENGKIASQEVIDSIRNLPLAHVNAALGAAGTLRASHVPFGVVTRKNLKELSRYQVLILPNILRLSDEEADAIKKYISDGGNVYASKFTLKSALAKVFDASYIKETKEKVTYIAPTPNGRSLLPETSEKYPLTIMDSQVIVETTRRDGVMATMMFPYTGQEDPSRFVSIHSNPPGVLTEHPALIYRELGKGRILWSSAAMETQAVDSLKHRSILLGIVKWLAKSPFSFEAAAPECVEVTMFHEKAEKRYLINLLSFQSEIGAPNIPVEGIKLKVRMPRKIEEIKTLPDGTRVSFKQNAEYTEIDVPKLLKFRMLALDYE